MFCCRFVLALCDAFFVLCIPFFLLEFRFCDVIRMFQELASVKKQLGTLLRRSKRRAVADDFGGKGFAKRMS